MIIFRRKSDKITAVRYGKEETGEWYDGCLDHVAHFLKGVDADGVTPIELTEPLTEAQICEVLTPYGAWDPPHHATLFVLEKGRILNKLRLGWWIARDANGDVWIVDHASLFDDYEVTT